MPPLGAFALAILLLGLVAGLAYQAGGRLVPWADFVRTCRVTDQLQYEEQRQELQKARIAWAAILVVGIVTAALSLCWVML